MRLTLRTLLAYQDEILEPADAEDLKQKLEESDFARELSRRISDVTQRARLGAPKLDGRGIAFDPNTVAEYLDNTLASERVPDFEMVCLESDVHLAEVASAHQILALVLGEPAEVDPASRQRMYGVINAPAAPKTPEPESDGKGVPGAQSKRKIHRRKSKPSVPDYLKEPEPARRRAPLAFAAVVLGALCLLAWALWIYEPHEPQVTALVPAVNPPSTAVSPDPAIDSIAKDPLAPETAAVEEPVPGEADRKDDTELVQPDATVEHRTPADTPVEAPTTSAPTPPAEKVEAEPLETVVAPSPPSVDVVPMPPAPAADADAGGVGRVTSSAEEILLRRAAATDEWVRAASRSTLLSGDRIVGLPGFRSSVALANGLTVQIFGGTILDLGAIEGDAASLELIQGRIILLTVGKAGSTAMIRSGGVNAQLVFENPDGAIGIAVDRAIVPGEDPEKTAPVVSISMYVTSGRVSVSNADGGAQSLAAPAQLTLGRTAADVPEAAPPSWLMMDDRSDLERRAAEVVQKELTGERPVAMTLTELVENRRREVSAVAARSLALIDVFERFPALLEDSSSPWATTWSSQYGWAVQLEGLRDALARGSQTAALVRKSFEQYNGARAPERFRMLWGYSREQLEGGELANLVAFLADPETDRRVLAFWNLNRMSGVTFGYSPGMKSAQREIPIQKWRQRLDNNTILPPLVERPAPDSAPAAAAPST